MLVLLQVVDGKQAEPEREYPPKHVKHFKSESQVEQGNGQLATQLLFESVYPAMQPVQTDSEEQVLHPVAQRTQRELLAA